MSKRKRIDLRFRLREMTDEDWRKFLEDNTMGILNINRYIIQKELQDYYLAKGTGDKITSKQEQEHMKSISEQLLGIEIAFIDYLEQVKSDKVPSEIKNEYRSRFLELSIIYLIDLIIEIQESGIIQSEPNSNKDLDLGDVILN